MSQEKEGGTKRKEVDNTVFGAAPFLLMVAQVDAVALRIIGSVQSLYFTIACHGQNVSDCLVATARKGVYIVAK